MEHQNTMEETRLSYLITGYIIDSLTDEEKDEVNAWVNLSESNKQILADLSNPDYRAAVDENQRSYDASSAFVGFISCIRQKELKIQRIRYVGIAASLLLVCFISFYFYKLGNETEGTFITSRAVIVPGSNKAILTLANGKNVNLNEAKQGIIAVEGNASISKTKGGAINYVSKSTAVNVNLYNTITTPRGGQYELTLSDGTHVWLNAASSIKYPVKFGDKGRQVEITGEAFFDVAHNTANPFKVMTKGQVVEVLGTQFNVNSYTDEPDVVTTLIRGRVKVNATLFAAEKYMSPGQQSILTVQSLHVSNANIEAAVAWKNGYFRFQNAGIKEVMRKLSRWYDFEVVLDSTLSNEELNGTISRNKSIKQVLSMLEYTNSIRFKVEGRRVTVLR